jgi:hypothetical protein
MFPAASRFALRQAVAETLHVPLFLVGITVVANGTDTPEIINSLISSYLGHGDTIGPLLAETRRGESCDPRDDHRCERDPAR